MKRSKIQLSLRHLKIVVMLIIVVFSNDIMCQKRHLRRPANPKSLGYSKSLQSASLYNSNNNRSGGGNKAWPFKFVNKSTKQRKWKKPVSSNSALSKKKGLLKPKLSRKTQRGPSQRFTRPRPTLGLKGLGGLMSKKPQRIIKKLGPSSSAFGRSKKYRPSNRGQNRSGSIRNQLYSSLPNSDIDNGIRRQSSEASNRVRRKLDVINEWINRIKDSTKHHSMSPSYTSKSRIQTIPVSSLPLQNEPVDNFHLSKGKKIINQLFQPQSLKPQQKKRPNKGGPRSKKGQKKQSIWPTKLSLGFLGNKSKSKRPFSSKKPSLAAKHPAPFSSPSLQPPRPSEIINKVKPKRLNPHSSKNPLSSHSFAKDHFPPNNNFPTTLNIPNNEIRSPHSSPSSSKGAFVVDPTFSPFNIQTAAAGSSAGGFFPKPYEHSTRGSPNQFPVTVNPLKRKNFGQPEGNKFGLNFQPNNQKPIQFTPTEGYQGIQNNKENFFGGGDSKLMGNPLSRYRPMPMEEPITDIGKFNIPTSTSKFFDKRKDTRQPEYPTRKKNTQSNQFPNFSSFDSEENEVMEFDTKSSKYANQRPSSPRKKNLRKKVDRLPYPKSTTPRPIPIPGKDFDFVVRPKVPSSLPVQPQQPALPVSNPVSNYDRNFKDYNYDDEYNYDDGNDYDNDNNSSNDVNSFGGDDKFSESVGFMDSGFGPAWEPNKVGRKKRDAPEGRSAASSIFWHNGQPIRPRNRKNRRRNRQNVWGERNPSEEEDGLDYHGIRGNRDGGYHHGSGGRGQTEAADFWEDFNVHDPQSIYADKFSAQEEYGGNGGNYPQNSYKPTPAVESSWGQRQPINRIQTGRKERYHRDPYPQQSIQDRYHGKERYGNEFYGDPIYVEEKNEVLGSGNFDVIQGGTFYDGDIYYDEYDYNRPQPTRYDSENNIENNFRDFADIKNDLLKYDQGYVPRYKK